MIYPAPQGAWSRLATLLVLLPAAALADRLELKDGKILEGRILNEGAKTVYLKTSDGIRSVPAEEAAASKRDAPLPEIPPPCFDFGPLEEKDLVARIGPGGVTRRELEFYEKGQNRAGALLTAIEDELLFQEALEQGLHKDDYVRNRANGDFRSNYVIGKVDPESFKEAELLAFHKAHLDLYTEPASLRLRYLQLPRKSDPKEVATALKQARAKPDTVEGWTDLDWVRPEDLVNVLNKCDVETIFKLKAGQVSDPIKNSGGFTDIFHVIDRKEALTAPLEQVRDQVAGGLMGERHEALIQALLVDLRKEGKGLDDKALLYRVAMKAGMLREWETKRYLGNCVVEKRTTKDRAWKEVRVEVLKELWKKYPVRVLLDD